MMAAGIYRFKVDRGAKHPKFYVGQTKSLSRRRISHLRDLRKHRHYNIKFQRAFCKYGEAAISFEILVICEPKKSILSLYEQLVVDMHSLEELYNICLECVDSALGTKRSPETIEKNRIRAIGNKSRTGMPHTTESRQKMVDASKNYIATKDQSWRRLAALGSNFSLGGTGRVWITDGTLNRRIKDTEVLPDGWRFGRIFKFHKPRSAANRRNISIGLMSKNPNPSPNALRRRRLKERRRSLEMVP